MHLFPEVDTGFRKSQASLIWRELEEEEEGLNEGSSRLFDSALWRRQLQQNEDDEDKDIDEVSFQHQHRSRKIYPDDDCGHFFVLGTLAAIFALLINLVYPLL